MDLGLAEDPSATYHLGRGRDGYSGEGRHGHGRCTDILGLGIRLELTDIHGPTVLLHTQCHNTLIWGTGERIVGGKTCGGLDVGDVGGGTCIRRT